METPRQRALVTGASSGLGVELAKVLAQHGIDLVLAARRLDRLDALAAQLRSDHGIDVVAFRIDLSSADGPQQLFDQVQSAGLRIDILVNNAGMGHFGPFLKQSLAQIQEMIAVDVVAVTTLTRLFAEKMKQQGGGHILLVSSFAALAPIPRYSIYSAAKAFLIAFVQALGHEWKHSGVHLSAVVPGFMWTEFHDVAHHQRTSLMKLTTLPVHYTARKAINGMFRGKLLITPGLFYQFAGVILRLSPRRMVSALSRAWLAVQN